MTVSVRPHAMFCRNDLLAAIAMYERALPAGTRYTFDLAPLDDLGLPVYVEVLVAGGVWYDGHGYGVSAEEARVGALGELSEVVHLGRALAADPGVTASFEEMVARRTPAGLLSEDIDPQTNELWGNYPQTYSLVGLINCAVLLSRPWSTVR